MNCSLQVATVDWCMSLKPKDMLRGHREVFEWLKKMLKEMVAEGDGSCRNVVVKTTRRMVKRGTLNSTISATESMILLQGQFESFPRITTPPAARLRTYQHLAATL